MTPAARREYVRALRPRYTLAPRRAKPGILNEFCATTGYNRKYAIAVPNCPVRPPKTSPRRLLASGVGEPAELRALPRLRTGLDPFVLAATIDRKLQAIYRLANRRHSPRAVSTVSPRFTPQSRDWNHDWLFQPRPYRRSSAGAR